MFLIHDFNLIESKNPDQSARNINSFSKVFKIFLVDYNDRM